MQSPMPVVVATAIGIQQEVTALIGRFARCSLPVRRGSGVSRSSTWTTPVMLFLWTRHTSLGARLPFVGKVTLNVWPFRNLWRGRHTRRSVEARRARRKIRDSRPGRAGGPVRLEFVFRNVTVWISSTSDFRVIVLPSTESRAHSAGTPTPGVHRIPCSGRRHRRAIATARMTSEADRRRPAGRLRLLRDKAGGGEKRRARGSLRHEHVLFTMWILNGTGTRHGGLQQARQSQSSRHVPPVQLRTTSCPMR